MLRAVLRSLRNLARRRDGASAVEFALIAPVFVVLLLGTLEASTIYIASSSLQVATDNSARLVRTGQAQLTNMTQAQFRQSFCSKLAAIVPCNNNLQIDVEAFTNYTGAQFPTPLTQYGTLDPSLRKYQPGTACSVVLVRAFYVWPVITPVLTPFLINMANNSHLLVASAAFRNEPFTTAVAGC